MVHEIRERNLFKKLKDFKNSVGNKTFYALIVLPILVLTTAIVFSQTQIRQNIIQKAAPQQTHPNRITYLGSNWYLHGVNVPWYNWSCDFGCNQNGGVSSNLTTLRTGFQKAKDSGMHTIRWWVFPGNPWQITKDQNGHPNGLSESIYADFDAALLLAEEFDLYYNFVLFSSATDLPSSWLTDTTQRTKLAQVLGTLFARYSSNPRVMSWEIFNEPEFQIWGGQVQEAPVVATVEAISNSVHQNSNALTTVGGAMLDGLPIWKNTSLDYYSPHWYDYMSNGSWCAICTTYDEVKNRYGLTKPIVIGELYIGSDTNPLQRFNDFYNKGYAGAWPWSLFPERTQDRLAVDFNAAATFDSSHNDLGPSEDSVSPTVVPSPTPTSPPDATQTPPTPTPLPNATNTPIPLPTATNTPIPLPTATNTPVPQPTANPTKTPAQKADFNNNGTVDIQDLSYLLTRWASSDLTADLNNDGAVGIVDLSILLSNWGL